MSCGSSSPTSCSSVSLTNLLLRISRFFTYPTQVTHLYAKVDYDDLTDAFAVALSDATRKFEFVIDNATDKAVDVSVDGTAVTDTVQAWCSAKVTMPIWYRYEDRSIYLRYSDTAPTTGWVVVTARA